MERNVTDSLIDMYIRDSKVYKGLTADAAFHFASEYLSVDYEGIIRITEDIEDIILSLQALEIDRGIPFEVRDFDCSHYWQGMFVKLAGMCSGAFAHDTLCQYLSDCGFVQCQLAIAHHAPGFYDKVTDKSAVKDEVKTYLSIVT